MAITFSDRFGRADLAYGALVVEPLVVTASPAPLRNVLHHLAEQRREHPLAREEEERRRASRDTLRNGRYKPTGRGKPASEYLLRAAQQGQLPLINGPVDANNYISLRYVIPASVWDLDRAGATSYAVRLGAPGERYLFNDAGQELDLEDLVCGAADADDRDAPIVSPVKDSLGTKIGAHTRRIAGLVYYPMGQRDELERIMADFARWLASCGDTAHARWAILEPGGTVVV
jgi:DNA/RNA-binding domain of Phe-tRNA-synthetase-like protein